MVAAVDSGSPAVVALAVVLAILLSLGLALGATLGRELGVAREARETAEARGESLDAVESSHRLARRLSAAVSTAEVAGALLEQLQAQFRGDAIWLSALSPAGGELELVAQRGFPVEAELAAGRMPLDSRNPAAAAVRQGKPGWYGSAEDFASRHPEAAAGYRRLGTEALAVLPLIAGGRTMGFVALGYTRPRRLTPAERTLLSSWTRQGAEALVRARLYESEREARESADEARRLAARLQRTTAHLAAAIDLAEVAEVVVGELGAALGAVASWLSLLDDSGRILELIASQGYSPEFVERYRHVPLDGPLAVADVVRRGEPKWVERAGLEREYAELGEARDATSAEGLAIVPLRSAGRVFGFVALRFREERTFSDAERTLLLTLADQCAQSLERARLYEREHRIALTLQQSVLPDELPELESAEVAGRYLPGAKEGQVGGDWYDVIMLPGHSVAAVVGDVVGKGIAAASAMAQLRNALRAFSQEGFKPSTLVGRINRLARAAGLSFATLLYLVLDPRTGLCRFASAGHLPPLVVHEDGSAWFVEGGRSLPIGVADDTTYRQAVMSLSPGWTVLLFTDGLIERKGQSLEQGLARLQEIAGRLGPDPETLLDGILHEMLPDEGRADDVALLALRPLALRAPLLRLRIPADVSQLSTMRRRLRTWLVQAGAGPDETADIVLAASEICANAMEHPEAPAEPYVELEASAADGAISLLVKDSGHWRELGPDPDRGFGLMIVEQLMDRVERSESERGTELRLTRSLRNGRPR